MGWGWGKGGARPHTHIEVRELGGRVPDCVEGGWVGRKDGKVLMSGGGGGREPWVGISQRRTSRTARVML